MIQLEQQQHGEFVVGWVGSMGDSNYLYPARWGWINNFNYYSLCAEYLPKLKGHQDKWKRTLERIRGEGEHSSGQHSQMDK